MTKSKQTADNSCQVEVRAAFLAQSFTKRSKEKENNEWNGAIYFLAKFSRSIEQSGH